MPPSPTQKTFVYKVALRKNRSGKTTAAATFSTADGEASCREAYGTHRPLATLFTHLLESVLSAHSPCSLCVSGVGRRAVAPPL